MCGNCHDNIYFVSAKYQKAVTSFSVVYATAAAKYDDMPHIVRLFKTNPIQIIINLKSSRKIGAILCRCKKIEIFIDRLLISILLVKAVPKIVINSLLYSPFYALCV